MRTLSRGLVHLDPGLEGPPEHRDFGGECTEAQRSSAPPPPHTKSAEFGSQGLVTAFVAASSTCIMSLLQEVRSLAARLDCDSSRLTAKLLGPSGTAASTWKAPGRKPFHKQTFPAQELQSCPWDELSHGLPRRAICFGGNEKGTKTKAAVSRDFFCGGLLGRTLTPAFCRTSKNASSSKWMARRLYEG